MKYITKTTIIIATVFLFLIAHVGIQYIELQRKNDRAYVTSEYSKYCYKNGSENKNIKVKIYYSSLVECGKEYKT